MLPFTRIRRLTAEHMVRSKATSPHVLQAVEVDFFRVDQVRKTVRDAFKAKHGHSLTYLPFIAHAVCRALHDFPNLNSSVQGDGLVLHEHVNLAIAVDLGAEGLVAPVIKQAEKLVGRAARRRDRRHRRRARAADRLRPDDFSGGTYTLSNSGTFGTLITAPIINQPQVAILSTDGVRKKPVVSRLRKATRSRSARSASSRSRSTTAPSTARTRPRSSTACASSSRTSHWLVEV